MMNQEHGTAASLPAHAAWIMEIYDAISDLLGLKLDPKNLSLLQVSVRAGIVLIATLAMGRLAEKRFLARLNTLDAILAFILGSMLSRAINGSAPFFPTLGGGFVIVFLHRAISTLAYHSESFGDLVKGKEEVVIDHGKIEHAPLRRNHVTQKDLFEELRLNGNLDTTDKVKKAVMERSGEISVVKES
jgi:uncharacterized membrane protein YcaP (DUF421 family)